MRIYCGCSWPERYTQRVSMSMKQVSAAVPDLVDSMASRPSQCFFATFAVKFLAYLEKIESL